MRWILALCVIGCSNTDAEVTDASIDAAVDTSLADGGIDGWSDEDPFAPVDPFVIDSCTPTTSAALQPRFSSSFAVELAKPFKVVTRHRASCNGASCTPWMWGGVQIYLPQGPGAFDAPAGPFSPPAIGSVTMRLDLLGNVDLELDGVGPSAEPIRATCRGVGTGSGECRIHHRSAENRSYLLYLNDTSLEKPTWQGVVCTDGRYQFVTSTSGLPVGRLLQIAIYGRIDPL